MSELKDLLPDTTLSLIDATVGEVVTQKITTVGLLASPTTIRTNLYAAPLAAKALAVIVPTDEQIEVLERAIRAVIAGQASIHHVVSVRAVVHSLLHKGADAVILGCTELSVLLSGREDLRLIDPLEVISKQLVEVK